MENTSERREHLLRAAAIVKASDIAIVAISRVSSLSLQEHCTRRFGAKASSFFALELELASRFTLEKSHLGQTVIATNVATGKKRYLILAPGTELWQCSCGIMVSRLVPCKHLVRYFQDLSGVTFETYAPYFHDRCVINTTLPVKIMSKIALNASIVRDLVTAETIRQGDFSDGPDSDKDTAATAVGDGFNTELDDDGDTGTHAILRNLRREAHHS